MDHGLLNDIAVCIMAAWLIAVGASLLRQPLIIAYLAAGMVVGPFLGLGIVSDQSSIQTISKLGLILLLFMIGLEIDLKKMVRAGRVITVTALTQIVGGFLLALGFFWMFGFNERLDALYLAVAATLSSTVIVVKVLYDKREIDTLPGRITLGVLVLQNLFAMLFLAVQPTLATATILTIFFSLAKVLLLIAVAFTVSRYALPHLFKAVARLPELVSVGALAWCFLITGLGGYLNLSWEIGALIAGMALSTFPYTLDVVAKVTSLRDFFVTLFFVALGLNIPMPTGHMIKWAIVFAAVVYASRFLTVFLPLQKMNRGHRASILPAVNLSQVSEFSLVIVAMGYQPYAQVSRETVGMLSYAFVLMAVLSTYSMTHSEAFARWASQWLSDLNVGDLDEKIDYLNEPVRKPRIFILGCSWAASSLIEEIKQQDPGLLNELAVIDFNPQVNDGLRARKVHVIYGDISQRDTLLHAGVDQAEIIVSALPNSVLRSITNLNLVRMLRQINPSAQIIGHAEFLRDLPELYAAGANFVTVPRLVEAVSLLDVIQSACNGHLEERRGRQDAEMAGRNEVIS